MIEENGTPINLGDLMILDSPRISYHPMDLILGVDFLLSNFLPENWNNLTSTVDEYNTLVEKYQNLFLNYKSVFADRVMSPFDLLLFI